MTGIDAVRAASPLATNVLVDSLSVAICGREGPPPRIRDRRVSTVYSYFRA
jgi:hypothetical protein